MADSGSSKHIWAVKPEDEVHIKVAEGEDPPVTLLNRLKDTVANHGQCPALKVKRGGEWSSWDYNSYYSDMRRAAKSLIKLGLERYHGVGIIGFNSPEWAITFMSSMMAGGIGVGVYTTNSTEICQHIADNSRAQIFVCENNVQVQKILEIKPQLPSLKHVVKYLPETEEELDPKLKEEGVLTWNEFMEIGKDVGDDALDGIMESLRPGHCCSLIYTSGTTGSPKGVMLSHDNLIFVCNFMNRKFSGNENDCVVSFLPLSHIAGQVVELINPMLIGACVCYAQPDALKGTLKDTIQEVRPTALMTVPRVWEKFKEGIETQLGGMKGVKKFIVDKSMDVGKKAQANRVQGLSTTPFGYGLANKLVFQGVKEKVGLDRCRLFGSGGAPLSNSVSDFYAGFDIPLYQVYGMSESSSLITVNTHESFKPFTVGKQLDGIEVKIDKPNDSTGEGEICVRGRNVFMGYIYNEEKMKEVTDEEGWLYTGDLGVMDSEGFYTVTGRKKELIITRGGENIAPLLIEEAMKEEIPIISHVVVIGDEQKYLTMLITLKCQPDENLKPTDQLSPVALNVLSQINSPATTVTEAISDQAVLQFIQQGMERANQRAVSRAARVQKFTVLPSEFTILGGELTSTFKIKRSVVVKKYEQVISEMYTE